MKPFLYYTPVLALAALLLLFASTARASETDGTIITNTNVGYAWSTVGGYVNFGLPASSQVAGEPNPDGYVHVTDTQLTGYAWDANYGWLNLNPSNGGVTNDSEGNLGGNAWSAGGGWISFDGITIDDEGNFSGVTATSDSYGRLSFDCTFCDVRTDWRPASVRAEDTTTGAGGSGGSISGSGVTKPEETMPPEPSVPFIPALQPAAVSEFVPAAGGSEQEPEPETELDETDDFAEGDLLPEELFDIRLVIDRRTLQDARELVARATFESFGRVPTPVELTFSIVNSSGATLYSSSDSVVIETEGVLVTRFDDAPELPEGSYALRLNTLYNLDVADNFEIPFEIVAEKEGFSLTVVLIVGAFLLLLAAIGIYFMLRQRKDDEVEDATSSV